MGVNIQTIKDIKLYLLNELGESYPEKEIYAFSNIITKTLLGHSKLHTLAFPENIVSQKNKKEIIRICKELKVGRPLQYILGETSFYNCTIKVNNSVLIPRPETEELTDLIIKENHGFAGSVLDIGTGSGCIAIALAVNLPGASVSALELSDEAITIARVNAEMNRTKVRFINGDIFDPDAKTIGIHDIFVSNPPYIRESEKTLMEKNVLDHEPRRALFVPDNDPLLYYRAIHKLARSCLRQRGKIFFEINESMGKQIYEMLDSSGYQEIEIRKDINGKDRMAKCIKNG
jgi:release factor glutamine methyltransferase